jgi:hypothetical protein
MVVDMFEHERIGPAIELILNYIESEDMIMFGALVLGGMTLLIWPERRRPATSVREEATA